MCDCAEVQYKPTLIDKFKHIIGRLKYKVETVIVRFSLSIIHWASKDSNYKKHARREFKAMGYISPEEDKEDGPNKWIQENVLDLLALFSTQGHSGSSAPFCVRYFEKMALFEPVAPLTGEDWEWNGVGEGTYQNNRCSHVFKDKDGRAYDIDAIVWRNQKGATYTGEALNDKGIRITSRQFIKFPFTPKTFYIDVIEEEIGKDDFEFHIKDKSQFNEALAHFYS